MIEPTLTRRHPPAHGAGRRRPPPARGRIGTAPVSTSAVRAALDGAPVQRAATVGPVDDVHEREATALAEQGGHIPLGPPTECRCGPGTSGGAPPEPEGRAPQAEKRPDEEPLRIQRVPLPGLTSVSDLDSGVAARIAAPGAGRPLPPPVGARPFTPSVNL